MSFDGKPIGGALRLAVDHATEEIVKLVKLTMLNEQVKQAKLASAKAKKTEVE